MQGCWKETSVYSPWLGACQMEAGEMIPGRSKTTPPFRERGAKSKGMGAEAPVQKPSTDPQHPMAEELLLSFDFNL